LIELIELSVGKSNQNLQMETEQKPFQTFEDLEAYRSARGFRKAMYAVGRKLPDFEKFGLASQIRRAAVSLTNNIAEGHGRWHFLDHIKFVLQGRGSLTELLDDLNICEDENYLPTAEIVKLKEQGWHVLKLINGYLRYLRDLTQLTQLTQLTKHDPRRFPLSTSHIPG